MQEDESVAGYVAKVNQLASEIEQTGEKFSDKMKMVRIISGLPVKFNNYKTVWYNTRETRSLDTLMASLQLEEENLGRMNNEQAAASDAAFMVKAKKRDFKQKPRVDELKKKTKCNACGQIGHWARDKKCPKNSGSTDKNNSQKENKEGGEMAWCATERASKQLQS